MCVALILLTNSFYKVYYWLFDLCEHALVSLLLLTTVFLFFLPVLMSLESEEQRPLFTIAVLVSGVVGGLAVVMTVVYLYRFCLKKRPPVTTTGKPDHKREQIRSIATSQCRPLPLPLAADANPYQTTHNTTPPRISESLVEKEAQFGSPTRIAQVFPLIPKEIPYVQRSVGDVSQKSYLSVGEAPARAQSAEHLKVTDPEIRRASFDVPRGTGRQLPSTEGLEQKYADRARRMSTFARSNAIQGQFPVKQNSSPLPEHKRIYERGHAHSRSWNPEGAQLTPPPIKEPVHYQYYQMNEVYPEHSFIPKINEPEVHSLAVRPFQRQAKSFDERDRGRGDVGERRKSMDRRTASDAERSFTRQATLNILQPDVRDYTPVAAACQTLWAAKGHLEQLHALGISDPSSASTSFESNTDSHTAGGGIDDKERDGDAERKRLKYRLSHRSAQGKLEKLAERKRPDYQQMNYNKDLPTSLFRSETAYGAKHREEYGTKHQEEYGAKHQAKYRSDLPSNPKTNVRSKSGLAGAEFPRQTRLVNNGHLYHSESKLMKMTTKESYAPKHNFKEISKHERQLKSKEERKSSEVSSVSSERRPSSAASMLSQMMHKKLPQWKDFIKFDRKLRQFSMEERRRREQMQERQQQEMERAREKKRSQTMRDEEIAREERRQQRDERQSLLIQRKFLSTAAVSSMDSTNSTESSAPDAMFASSMDSTKSELEQRRLSLMTRHAAISTPHISNIRQHASMDHGSTRPVASIEPFLAPQGVNSRRLMERDFSVDSKSDNLFREWSRVDPAYAEKDRRPVVQQKPQALLQRGATEDHVQYPQRERRYSRQMTIGGGGVIVPLICYPDEQNCSR